MWHRAEWMEYSFRLELTRESWRVVLDNHYTTRVAKITWKLFGILLIRYIQRNRYWFQASKRLRRLLQAFLTISLFKFVNVIVFLTFISTFVLRRVFFISRSNGPHTWLSRELPSIWLQKFSPAYLAWCNVLLPDFRSSRNHSVK